jgi:hypothetical protein
VFEFCGQILVVGPKLVFSYTLAQSLIPFFGRYGEDHGQIRLPDC